MAISTILTSFLNGLSDGEARQLVSHLKKMEISSRLKGKRICEMLRF